MLQRPVPPPPSSSESSSSLSEDDQESDHEAYELPPVPPQKTCGSGLPKAHVAQADYPRRVIGNLVEHEPIIYFDEELDCPDLEPENYGPIVTCKKGQRVAQLAPDELAAEIPWCFFGKTFARKNEADVNARTAALNLVPLIMFVVRTPKSHVRPLALVLKSEFVPQASQEEERPKILKPP
uniref:Uncharacterized protein n=1 Tax=Tetranychus urticae TaxID=32264 RepID=T1KRG9_TETUR